MTSLTFVDKIITTQDEIEDKFIIQKETKTPFSCVVLKDSDIKIAKAIKKTLKDWKDIANDRLGSSRELYSTDDPSKVTEDRKTVDQYKELLTNVSMYLDSFINQKQESTARKILFLTKDTHIQAIGCVSLKEHLYVNILISAPTNIRMYGKIQEQHKHVYGKGAGTALMYSIYKLTQKLEIPKIKLTPLEGSHSFYKDQIGMKEVQPTEGSKDKTSHFELSVSSKVPEQLLKKSYGLVQDIDW